MKHDYRNQSKYQSGLTSHLWHTIGMEIWQLQEAKAKLSSLIKKVMSSGPQGISIRGLLEVVVISKSDYEKLLKKKPSFVQLMNKSPLKGLDLDIGRDQSEFREVDL